jgi:hypothetical protein
MKKTSTILVIIFFTFGLFPFNFTNADSTASKLKGKILLQVEQNGEAWYVEPSDQKRYFMGRPDDAFSLMRSLGIGISNNDLQKIQIADVNLTGIDNDNDGLSNLIEDSIGTDKNNKDSDNDGYFDKNEILNGYNPKGPEKLIIDNIFSKNQAGKILLQVERNGEAWYVYPDDNKRYFLGKPTDAFNVMRDLGLGINNSNLELIAISEKNKTVNSINENVESENNNNQKTIANKEISGIYDHIKVFPVAIIVKKVIDKVTGKEIELHKKEDSMYKNYAYADFEKEGGEIFPGSVYLPSDKTYNLELQMSDFIINSVEENGYQPSAKIFISIPYENGELKKFNYDNLRESKYLLSVGRQNEDFLIKSFDKNTKPVEPDWVGTSTIEKIN